METGDAKRTWRPTRRIVAAACALALLGYPLSFGPAIWLLNRGYIPPESWWVAHDVLYGPVVWFEDHAGRAGEPLRAYLRVWIKHSLSLSPIPEPPRQPPPDP